MIIRRVHIRRFRKLVDQVLECGPGLNVIHGRNDAGKSTLHLAFSAALFPVRPSEAKSYGTWGEGESGEITVEFEADGGSCRLHKDFGSRKVVLTSGGEAWENPKEVERRIGEVLGLTSLSLFRATAHIRQWDLAGVQEEGREIGTRLARIVTGGDSDATRVLSAIDERIRRLEVGLRHPSKTPGAIRRDQDRLAALTADQQRLAAEVEAIERAATERDRLVAQIGELEQRVHDDEELLKVNRQLLELVARWKQLSVRAKEMQSLIERVTKAGREAAAADQDEALGVAVPDPEALRRLQEAEARVRVLEAACAQEATAERSIPSPGPAGGGSPLDRALLGVGPAGFGLAALLAAVLGVGLLALGRAPWSVGPLAVAVLLAGAAVVARGRERAAAAEAIARTRRQERVRELEERRRAAQSAADELTRSLRVLGVPSVRTALELAERRRQALTRQASSRTLLAELLGGRTLEDLTAEHQQVLLELGMVRAQREEPDLILRQLDPAGIQRLQTEAAARKTRFIEARGALQRLEGRLSGRLPHEDLARVEEDLAATRERLARAQRFVEVLRLAGGVLLEAHRQTIVPGKALLEERASRYLRELSGGAYDRVVVDEHSLAPRVWVGPPKEWAEVDAASREIGSGAADQCYLALRLALIDVLCDDRRPPLFLDDPFLAYDEGRKSSAMRLLQDLARDRQIFFLTCREDYHRYADHLILLDAAPAVAPGGLELPLSARDEVSASGP